MMQRFQIEDLIVQDGSGVIFRAKDLETGGWVALRRFFPFGADGGGLNADEQIAYEVALSRLADLKHPSLRPVVCGGCDPVDGIPFIATSWCEGETLESLVSRGPLEVDRVIHLVSQALEVSELLSQALGEEAVWVETEFESIIVSEQDIGTAFTFWISPFKWLRGDVLSRGMGSIITLTEIAMGWQGQIVNDQAGGGLGGWLKSLETGAGEIRLQDARQALLALGGSEPPAPMTESPPAPVPTRQLVRTPVPLKPVPLKSASSKAPLIAAGVVVLIVGALAAYVLTRPALPPAAGEFSDGSQAKPPKPAPKIKPASKAASPKPVADVAANDPIEIAEVTRKANEQLARLQQTDDDHEEKLRTQQAAAEQQGGVIDWNQRELLLEREGKVVTMGGTATLVEASGSGKTVYLVFGSKEGKNYFRAGMMRGGTELVEVRKSLEPFLNKEIQITGEIVKRKAGRSKSVPEMVFSKLTDIKVKE